MQIIGIIAVIIFSIVIIKVYFDYIKFLIKKDKDEKVLRDMIEKGKKENKNISFRGRRY